MYFTDGALAPNLDLQFRVKAWNVLPGIAARVADHPACSDQVVIAGVNVSD